MFALFFAISRFWKTASTMVFPVTEILFSSIPSARRYCRAVSVGAKS